MNIGPNFIGRGHWFESYGSYYYGYHDRFYSFDVGFDVKLGILMLAGNLNDRPYIIGIAPCIGYVETNAFSEIFLPLELRFGRVLGKRFYITGNINMGIPFDLSFMIEPSITLGLRLGKR